jgi:ABC-type uncharacterized transport system permease subunit
MIFDQILMLLPLILGSYIIFSLLKLPDFSLESAYLCGAIGAYLTQDLPLPVMLISSILGGCLVGMTVSTLHQTLKIPVLLSAIITNGLFHGLTQYVLGTSLKTFHPTLPMSEQTLFILIGAALITLFIFTLRSELGYSFAIYGNNPLFFKHHPVSERFVLLCGVMIGHACAGMSGFLFAVSSGFVDLTMNFGIVLLCLTAIILGKSLIKTHRPQVLIPLLGLILFFSIQQTLLRVGLNLKYFNGFQALFVLGALCLMQRRKKITLDHLGV